MMYMTLFGCQIVYVVAAALLLGFWLVSQKESGGEPLAAAAGVLCMQTGYLLSLQAQTLEGLQMADVLCGLGKLLALTGAALWVKKEGLAARLITAAALAGAAILLVSDWRELLYETEAPAQNQIFYYIERKPTMVGTVGIAILLFILLWSVAQAARSGGKKMEALLLAALLAAVILQIGAMAVLSRTLMHHTVEEGGISTVLYLAGTYDIMMPLALLAEGALFIRRTKMKK